MRMFRRYRVTTRTVGRGRAPAANAMVLKWHRFLTHAPTPSMSLRGAKRRGNLPGEGWIIRHGGMNGTGLLPCPLGLRYRDIVPGDSHVARLPRNDIFLRFPKYRYRCVVVTLRRGHAPALLSVYRAWCGLPPALLRSATPLINAGGEGVP